MNNKYNKIFFFFSPFNCKFSLENRLIDVFPNHFLFHILNRKNNHDIKSHLQYLDNITIQVLSNSLLIVVVMDANIKNQIATSISYIYSHDKLVIKTIHHAVNIMSTKAKLFVIRCGINQAIYLSNVNLSQIPSMLPKESLIYHCTHTKHNLLQSHMNSEFFKKYDNNLIEFWDCPSSQK